MINIRNNCEGSICGHIFKLEEKSSYDGVVSLDGSTTVVFVANSYYIYLNSSSIWPVSFSLIDRFEQLQKVLDYLSLKGIQNSSVKIPLGHYFYWEVTDNGYSIKLTESSISRFSTSVHISKLEVNNYHEGFRFFRFAQIAHDVFDAYRNLWLSFESLITTLTPRKLKDNGKYESEESWYCRSVTELAKTCQSNELNDLLKNKPSKILIRELYKDIRCSLFHSKHGERILIPHKIEEYNCVKASLTELTIIVTAILKHHYCIQSKFSWINPDLFIDGYKELFDGMSFIVSDRADEGVLCGEQFHKLNVISSSGSVTHKAKIAGNHVEHLFNASVAVEKGDTQEIRRFTFSKESKELMVFTLDESLSTDGVSHIEIESFLNFGYIEQPKTYDYRI